MYCASNRKSGLKSLPAIMLTICCVSLPALAESPVDVLKKRGEAFYLRRKADKALPFYNQALAINPNNQLCLMRKAQCLLMIQENEEAIPVISKLLSMGPDNQGYILLNALALTGLGKNEEALSAARKAYKIDASFIEANIELARALLNCHKYDEAQKFLTERLKTFPHEAALRKARIKVGCVQSKWEQVCGDCTYFLKEVKNFTPETVRTLSDRADAYKHLKKYDLAIKDYEEILRIIHDYRPAHVGLKDVYKLSGNKKMHDKEMRYLESLDVDSQLPI